MRLCCGLHPRRVAVGSFVLVVILSLAACTDGAGLLSAVNKRSLSARASASSTASASDGSSNTASATAVSTGGVVEAESRAIGESQSELKTDIAEAVANAVAKVENGGDAKAEAQAVATEIGRATARAIAKASVKVSVHGPGFASGSAQASSRAIARVTVTAIAEAFAKATGSSEASSRARAEVSESSVAEAAASAVAEAESRGGTAHASQTTIATAVAEVIAKAVASALATVQNDQSTATTTADAEANEGPGEASVDSSSSAGTGGSCNILWNIDLAGGGVINDGKSTITQSNEECCALCQQRSDCKAWTRIAQDKGWNKWGECWLRNTVNSQLRVDFAHSGIVSGGSNGGSSSSCNVLWGIDLPGDGTINNGSQEITGSDGECCAKCDARSDCKAWTRIQYDTQWNKKGECWLRNKLNSKTGWGATNSGIKSGGSANAYGSGSADSGRK